MRLPVNVPFHSDTETPLSLASRLARAMSYPSVDDLLGGNTLAVARGDEDAISVLSSWSGVPDEQLRRFAVPVRNAAGEWRLGDAVFRKEMKSTRFRFCPQCFAEDVELGEGRPATRPYERAAWLTKAVKSCTRHHALLVEAEDGAPRSDVALFVDEGWHLRCEPAQAVDDAEIEVDAYIEARIAGNRTQSFIDRQEVHVLVMLFQFLGWFVQNRLPDFHIGSGPAFAMSERVCGFRIAREGREKIEAVIKQAIAMNMPKARIISEFFGLMVRHFRRNVDIPAYSEIIALFQELVERSVPVGPGERFILPVVRRHLHSVRSAAAEYGIDPQRARKILEERGVIKRSKLSDPRIYVSVDDAKAALAGLSENMTTVEVSAVLGLNEDKVRALIDRDLLEPTERGTTENRPFYRVGPAALDRFLNQLFDGAQSVEEDHGLVPLRSACRRKSLTQIEMIEMIMSGKLRRVGRADQSSTIGSILVDLDELPDTAPKRGGKCPDPMIDEDSESYLSLGELESALSTTTVTVSALVKHGALPTELRTNPRTRRKQPYVHRDYVDAFLESHRSLHRIARGWRRNIGRMKIELDLCGLKPIFETSGKIARYYRKEDLAKACLLPPNA